MPPAKRQPRGAGSVRLLRSGRYQARLKVDGVYHPAPHTFDTKLAAQLWLADQQRQIAAGTWTPPDRESGRAAAVTFGDFAQQWLATRDLKPRTRSHYRKIMDTHLTPYWGRHRIDTVTVAAVDAWYATLPADTPTMRAHIYGLFRTILMAAWRRDLIASNPCRVEGGGSVRRASKSVIPTAVQVHDLADAMPAGKYRVMVLMAAWTGLRFGELTELRPEDFGYADGVPVVVDVSRAVVRVDGQPVVGPPKSDAGRRAVVIPPHIRPDVARWLKKVRRGHLLFPGRDGSHMASSSLYWHFGQARDAVGLSGMRWHDLRHFSGTTAAQTGATLAEVMGRLGHSTSAAAMRYQHAASGRDEQIAEAMSSDVVPLRRKRS
jgi:integrase